MVCAAGGVEVRGPGPAAGVQHRGAPVAPSGRPARPPERRPVHHARRIPLHVSDADGKILFEVTILERS